MFFVLIVVPGVEPGLLSFHVGAADIPAASRGIVGELAFRAGFEQISLILNRNHSGFIVWQNAVLSEK